MLKSETTTRIVKRLIAVAIALAALYLLLLFCIPYLKENVHNYRAEALSSLQTLNLIQQDYRTAHGTYARSLVDLGPPLGAELVGERLD